MENKENKKINNNIKKIDFKEFLKKVNIFFKHSMRVIVILVAMLVGFAASQIYNQYNKNLEVNSLPKTKTHLETSIAINESGEFMIIDRNTGSYIVYSDSVGKMFFDLYASRLLYNTTKNATLPAK